MVTITLKGREIPLLYTTYEMKMIQEEIAPVNQTIRLIMGRTREEPPAAFDEDGKEIPVDDSQYGSAEHLEAVAKAVKILGNAGLEEAGEAPDLTEKWIMRAVKPVRMPEIANACMDAMTEGMKSELPDKEDDGPVDVTLQEMKKKEPRGG